MKKRFFQTYLHRNTRLYRLLRRLAHILWYGAMAVVALVAIAYASARLLLPAVTDKKAELEAFLLRQSGYAVRIEKLEGYWDGLHPGLTMQGIGVFAADGARPAVRLAELRISLQILPLLVGRPQIHSAVLTRPSLTLERLVDGRFRISGFAPVEQADVAQNETFVAWLFRQGRLAIEDGELQWLDRREPDRPVRLTHVNMQLRNSGDEHRLGVMAEFPPGLCDACSLVADISGNPFLGQSFQGEIYLRGRGVDVERMPRVIREQLPQTLRGTFSVELWSAWKGSQPVSVEGDLAVNNLRLPLADLRAPLSVKQVSAGLRWKGESNGFRLALKNLTLALHGAPWSAGELQFVRREQETSLRVGRVELADVTDFVAGLRLAQTAEGLPYEESAALWTALRPTGAITDIRVQLTGALDSPEDYTFSAGIEKLTLEPFRDWPGVRGAGGKLSMKRDAGELMLDVRDGALAWPRIFRAPIPISSATAHLRWERQTARWLFTTENIAFVSEDGRANGRLELQLPHDATQSPHLALSVNFRDGNGAHAARYYPVQLLAPGTLAWMESSFIGGRVTEGTLVYDGRTRDFPFTSGTGKFEVRAKVHDAIYDYLPGWQPVTGATADVTVDGERFLVTGQGRIGALKATEIVVTNGDGDTVQVRANLSGPIAESVRVLREVKSAPGQDTWKEWLPATLEAAGDGVLSLDLAVPTDDRGTRMRGEYRFLNGTLGLAGVAAQARAVTGSLRFTEEGVREGRVSTRLLGDEAVLTISSPRPDETVALAQGRMTAAGLAPVLGPRLAPQVSGAVPWEGRLRLIRGRREIYAEADLSELKASLPAPLNRPDGLGPVKLVVRTEAATRDSLTLGLAAGGLLQGRLRYAREGDWHLQAGRLVFNETPARLPAGVFPPSERGLHLLLRLDDLDLDRWLPYVDDSRVGAAPAWLARIGVEIRGLTLLDREFGRVNLDLAKEKSDWSGAIVGPAAAGRLRLATAPAIRIELSLARLSLPPSKHERRGGGTETDPRRLPHIVLTAKSFQIKDKELGEIEFIARPFDQGWNIERGLLLRPEARFEADGSWRMERGRASSQLNLRFSGQDLGKTMEALGVPDQMAGGEVELSMRLSWAGAPTNLQYASLNGAMEIDAKKGRFLQLKQGAGRVFGILDLSAIGRYLTLDFTPIFGKGFAFDRIRGKIEIERGNARSDDFSIVGPSAKIRTNGRIGLGAEDFDLTVDIYPSLSDSLTITGLLAGGPQVALWTLLVQKLFKKQIEEGTRVTYIVKGSWENPNITRKLVEVEKADTTYDK